MTTPTFPVLAGQGYSVKKKPMMSTIVAPHVSGREVRYQNWQNPIWQFEMPFYLDGTASGQYGALGAQSMQALLGLFLQCGGQFGTFVYYDPTDYLVIGQQFGTGNGTATTFQLTRSINNVFTESVVAPYQPAALAAIPAQGSPWPPMNTWGQSVGTNSGMSAGGVTFTGSVADPFGGTVATKCTETTATSSHEGYRTGNAVAAGGNVRFSTFLKNVSGSQYIQLALSGGSDYFFANFDIVNNLVTYSGAGGAGSFLGASAVGYSGGWSQVSLLGSLAPSDASPGGNIQGCGGNPTAFRFPVYAGSTSNAFDVAYPQIESVGSSTSATLDAVIPTLATINYGSPAISVGGVYVDPTSYAISNGIVTFTTAPANAAALTWTGSFGFLCRFDDDSVDFDQFMSNLWQVESLKFRSVRAQ